MAILGEETLSAQIDSGISQQSSDCAFRQMGRIVFDSEHALLVIENYTPDAVDLTCVTDRSHLVFRWLCAVAISNVNQSHLKAALAALLLSCVDRLSPRAPDFPSSVPHLNLVWREPTTWQTAISMSRLVGTGSTQKAEIVGGQTPRGS
jgi:hypothetical protein